MSENIPIESVLSAIQASGYLMEQEIASLLEDDGFLVTTNWAFKDQDQGVSREIDVKAFRMPLNNRENKVSLSVEVLCECKNSENPLVFIGRNKNPADPYHVPLEYIFPFDHYEKELPTKGTNTRETWADPPWRHLNLACAHYFYRQPDKAVQFARICRTGKRIEANHGGVYEALVYPLAKAVDFMRTEALRMREYMPGHVTLLFPIIVVNAPIYYIDSRAKTPVPVLSPHVSLMRHIDSATVKGQYLIDFVSKASLGSFIQESIMPFALAVAGIGEANPRLFLNKKIQIGEWDGIVPK